MVKTGSDRYSSSMRFSWDPKKAASNLNKHGISLRKQQPFLAIPFRILFLTQIIPWKSIGFSVI